MGENARSGGCPAGTWQGGSGQSDNGGGSASVRGTLGAGASAGRMQIPEPVLASGFDALCSAGLVEGQRRERLAESGVR